MLSSRQKLILKAIVENFVKEAQPIGSKALTKMPYLDFSSATIRYDMQVLEELGYLEKMHTSSGRVPSEKGYRYYVEHLVTRDSKVVDSFPLIDEIFDRHRYSRNVAVKEAIKLLSDLTNYTALAVGPSSEFDRIQKIDFVPVSMSQAVILIVTDKGHVQHQNLSIPADMDIKELEKVIKTLDDLLRGRALNEAITILKGRFARGQVEQFVEYQEQLVNSFIDAFAQFSKDNFYLSGMTNIFDQPEFVNSKNVKGLIEMLDRRDLIKIVGNHQGLRIKFGSDFELISLENYTVISVPYRTSTEEYGTVAVLGPARMEYSKVIPLIEYIASNIGKLYKK